MKENDFSARVLELLQSKQYAALHRYLDTLNPADIAEMMDDLLSEGQITQEDLPRIFRLLPKELAADTFVEMEPERRSCLSAASPTPNSRRSSTSSTSTTLSTSSKKCRPTWCSESFLRRRPRHAQADQRDPALSRGFSAGSIMTTEYVSLRPAMTVEEAILRIRRTGIDKETIYTCYVTQGRKLIGLVSVKDLLLCEDDSTKIESIMQEHVISVNTLDDQEQVAQMFSKYNFLALPVVDGKPPRRHRDLRRRHGRPRGRDHRGL
jgi:magnesium transporter